MADLMSALEMSEEQFRRKVRQIAKLYGWDMQYHTHNSRRSDAGWPDEGIAHTEHKRILFIELKTDKGRVTAAQKMWIDALQGIGMEAAIWRPKDIDLIVEVLGPKQKSLRLIELFS